MHYIQVSLMNNIYFLLQFNPKTRGWHKMPVELREPGHYMAAVILDENEVHC